MQDTKMRSTRQRMVYLSLRRILLLIPVAVVTVSGQIDKFHEIPSLDKTAIRDLRYIFARYEKIGRAHV